MRCTWKGAGHRQVGEDVPRRSRPAASSRTTRSFSSGATTRACCRAGRRFRTRAACARCWWCTCRRSGRSCADIKPGTRLQNLVGFEDLAADGADARRRARAAVHAGAFVPRAERRRRRRSSTASARTPARTTTRSAPRPTGITSTFARTRRTRPTACGRATSGRCRGRWRGTRRITRGRSTPQFRGFFEPKPVEQLFDLDDRPGGDQGPRRGPRAEGAAGEVPRRGGPAHARHGGSRALSAQQCATRTRASRCTNGCGETKYPGERPDRGRRDWRAWATRRICRSSSS